MRKLILMVGLVVVAFACSETAGEMLMDAGQMMMDAGNGMAPDAGAQPGELILTCDLELVDQTRAGALLLFAEVAASELPGPFNVYVCNDQGININRSLESGGDPEPMPECISAQVEIRPDGRFRFKCSRDSHYTSLHGQMPDGSYIKIVR